LLREALLLREVVLRIELRLRRRPELCRSELRCPGRPELLRRPGCPVVCRSG